MTYLKANFSYEKLIEKFGRVEEFGENPDDYKEWTFWTYAWRAVSIFGEIGAPINRQLRRHRLLIRLKVANEIEKAAKPKDLSISVVQGA